MAGPLGRGALLRPERMLELLAVAGQLLPLVLRAASFEVDTIGIAADRAARALNQIDAAVRSRRGGVVLQQDGATQSSPDQAAVHVAQQIAAPRALIIDAETLAGIELETARIAAHRHQVVEAVAPIDVQALGQRTDAVGRIQVAVAVDRVLQAPESLVTIAELDGAQIVNVGALGMQQLAQGDPRAPC